LKDNFFK